MSIVDSSTADTSISSGDLMTSGGVNAKGSYDEAIASTSEETFWVMLQLKGVVSDTNFLVDVAVGAASSEVVQINNIAFFGNNVFGAMSIMMPLTIASGSRVAVRCQATGGTAGLRYMMWLSNDNSYGTSTSNITMGADTSTSKGTTVDPGGTINTKGSYAELDSSTSIETNYSITLFGNNDNSGQIGISHLVDISTGAASSEVDVIANSMFQSTTAEMSSLAQGALNTIASGTRVSARAQAGNATVGDRLIDICVLGFNIVAPAGGSGGAPKQAGRGGGMCG